MIWILAVLKEVALGYLLGLGLSFIVLLIYKIPRTQGIIENTAGYQPCTK